MNSVTLKVIANTKAGGKAMPGERIAEYWHTRMTVMSLALHTTVAGRLIRQGLKVSLTRLSWFHLCRAHRIGVQPQTGALFDKHLITFA